MKAFATILFALLLAAPVVSAQDSLMWLGGEGNGIVEVEYLGSTTVCPDPANPDDWGCNNTLPGDIANGNTVWHETNIDGDYYISAGGGEGEVARTQRYIEAAQGDVFEIRFTENCATEGNCLGLYGFAAIPEPIISVPFELWNIGDPTNPDDDVRMIPFLNENDTPQANWADNFTGTDPWPDGPGADITDWVYYMQPDRPNGYDLFEADANSMFGGAGGAWVDSLAGDTQIDPNPHPDSTGAICASQGYYADFCFRNQDFVNNGGPSAFIYPIGRSVFADALGDGTTPGANTRIRWYPAIVNVSNEIGAEVPEGYALETAYPNPFNPSTVVPFSIGQAGRVTLTAYDVLGREVAVLLDETRAAGAHEATFAAGALPSGQYLIVLEAGTVRLSETVTLLK